jgi:F0F1-type ATP synthase assembly protein I
LHYVPLKCSVCGGKIKVSVRTKVLAAVGALVAAVAGWCLVRYAGTPVALIFPFAILGHVVGQRITLRLDAFE